MMSYWQTHIVQIPKQHPDTNSSWHLYIIRFKEKFMYLTGNCLNLLDLQGGPGKYSLYSDIQATLL